MIIPLAHENQRGRRWPWVTIAIIAINFVVFLATNGTLDRELQKIDSAELHILLLSARYPDTQMPPDAEEVVGAYKLQHADVYAQMAAPNRTRAVDSWDARFLENPPAQDEANSEMARFSSELQQARDASIIWKYAFHPFHPTLAATSRQASFTAAGCTSFSICGSCGSPAPSSKTPGAASPIRFSTSHAVRSDS
ncbi:MAG: hypothetical protein WBP92_06105 [Candidatus Acidiferrales bacterium]